VQVVGLYTGGGLIFEGGLIVGGLRYINRSGNWKKREIVWKHDARRLESFHTISSFPNFHEC
jgi:hypothetical protein